GNTIHYFHGCVHGIVVQVRISKDTKHQFPFRLEVTPNSYAVKLSKMLRIFPFFVLLLVPRGGVK
ncbi:MAG: hypothetical protein PVJ11_06085, partial [Syntrophobacterales bacterium]